MLDIWPCFVFSYQWTASSDFGWEISHEYLVNAGVPQRLHSWFYTFPTLHYDLPDDVIFSIAIYTDDATLYSKCDQASDLWQQRELPSELESDVRDTRLEQEVVC